MLTADAQLGMVSMLRSQKMATRVSAGDLLALISTHSHVHLLQIVTTADGHGQSMTPYSGTPTTLSADVHPISRSSTEMIVIASLTSFAA